VGYVTVSDLKETLSLSGESFADHDIEEALEAASDAVNSVCGRRFTKADAESSRLYRPTRRQRVAIDDLAEFTRIESTDRGAAYFDDWGATGQDVYELLPYSAPENDEPFTSIALVPTCTTRRITPPDTMVRVTGVFGWPEVPAPVKTATKILASRLLKRTREAPFGVAAIGADGLAVRIGATDPDVHMLLEPLTRSTRLT
jgi:hypothetical protein